LQTLVNSNNKLSTAVTESTKRPRPDDLNSKSPIHLDRTAQPLTGVLNSLLRSEYPFVRFWTKDEWKAYHATTKDSSEVSTGNAQDNGAIGANKTMAYIEQDDGTPVSSDTAAQIRHFARSIWRGFRARGQAPKTWGEAPRELRDDYIRKMEMRWEVLRYCENHWKADAVATAVYSPWYNGPLKKANANKTQSNITEE
jgi:hypothetical protein